MDFMSALTRIMSKLMAADIALMDLMRRLMIFMSLLISFMKALMNLDIGLMIFTSALMKIHIVVPAIAGVLYPIGSERMDE